MRLKLLLSIIFFCAVAKAQTQTELKEFINKTDIALRSVQKNSIKLSDEASAINFKELLKLQIASVKLFNTDIQTSATMAYITREKCIDFLSINYPGSIVNFKLTNKEASLFSTKKTLKKINTYFSKSELQLINTIDGKNPHLFDDFITRIK